jgi:hypothetical protein
MKAISKIMGQIFPAAALDMRGAEDAPAAGIDQDGEDQPRMIDILVFGYEGILIGR